MGKNNSAPMVNKPMTGEELETNSQAVTQSPAIPSESTLNTKANGKKLNNKKIGKKGEKKENGFVRFFKKIGMAFKNMFTELKNVTWPPFAKVIASTGVVLMVVFIFFLVLMGFNSLFSWILNLIINI